MVDVMVAAVVLVIAIGGLSGAVVSTMKLSRTNEETAAAWEAIRQISEEIDNVDFDEIFATFNADPADDPDGPGTAPGAGFAAFGLNARAGDADGLVGSILFPVIGAQLREDVVDADLGMPRDLNGDGATDANDHSGDYTLLPLTVRLEWSGSNGNRELEVSLLLVQ